MNTTPYDSFLPEVLPYVRDCAEVVAINAIRNACMEFCEHSQLWREELPDVTLEAGEAVYQLEVPAGSGLAAIISARIGRIQLIPKSIEDLNVVLGPDWRDREGPVNYITHDDYDSVRLVMVPSAGYTEDLKMTVALKPLRSSTKVAKVVYERYAEIIGFGARARLHDTPNQSYSDEKAAKKFRMWFETGYGEAKIAANKGLTRAVLVVRPPTV